MKKKSMAQIIERLLQIYWQRAMRYQKAAWNEMGREIKLNEFYAAKYLGKHSGMSILYERMNCKEGK